MTEKTGVVGVPAEPTARDALRKKVMERMRPLAERSSHWNGWPGTWEFAEAALQAVGAALAAPPSPLPAPVEPTARILDASLVDLLEKARTHVMTDEEMFEQRVSFIYGCMKMDSGITKDQIRASLNAKRPAP